jgi:hypothetical protein
VLRLKLAGAEYDVARGTMMLPRCGVWTSDLTVNASERMTGSAVAILDGVEMPAHVQSAHVIEGMLRVRLVGGAGGLAKQATTNYYKGGTVAHVFRDLLRDAGESISGDCTQSVLNLGLQSWTSLGRLPVTVGSLIQALADSAAEATGSEVLWRVLFDGKVWLGIERWPMCPADVRILSADGPNRSDLLGTDALGIWPGTTIDGRRVDSVVHQIGGENRSTVYWAEGHL